MSIREMRFALRLWACAYQSEGGRAIARSPKDAIAGLTRLAEELNAEAMAAESRATREAQLADALWQYVSHKQTCRAWSAVGSCDCGLVMALAQHAAARK